MSGRIEWQPKLAGETVLRYADFTDELAAGDSLSGGSCVLTVWSGNDPAPPATAVTLMQNAAGLEAVMQVKIAGGVLGTVYQALCSGNTAAGLNYQKAAYLA